MERREGKREGVQEGGMEEGRKGDSRVMYVQVIESSSDRENAIEQILIGSTYVFFKSWFCVELQSIAARALVAWAVPRALVVLCKKLFA